MKRLILAILLLAGCEDSLEDQSGDVRKYFMSHQVGDAPDYGLYKKSALGDSFIGVVFGYMDDAVGCRDIASLLNKHRKTISEVFAGLYYGCPEWQDGLITLDDSKQWGLYGPIIQLLKEASTQMNREVETLSKWLVNDNPHYHNFKMLEAEDFFPGTMEHSILQT